MNINRDNYEEFFLLYVDNELSPAEKASVDQFLLENPDLNGELQLFAQTSLVSDDDIVFEGKELLMKHEHSSNLTIENYEEWLVAYIDNELTVSGRKDFEQFAALHPAVQQNLSIFLQTKLHAEEEVVFVNKEVLYRREEKVRVITMQWWKIAVAAAVILAVGITTFSVINRNPTIHSEVAGTNVKQPVPASKEATLTNGSNKEQINLQTPAVNKDEVASSKELHLPVKTVVTQKMNEAKHSKTLLIPLTKDNQEVIANKPSLNKSSELSLVHPAANDKKTIDKNTEVKKETAPLNNTIAAATNPSVKQNINVPIVTNTSNKPSDDKETAYDKTIDSGAVFASNNEEGKNKKLRGFFRKATRIFEKRTNISAADDDDKVLIGVLAVKLK